jgi:hypothetical protein
VCSPVCGVASGQVAGVSAPVNHGVGAAGVVALPALPPFSAVGGSKVINSKANGVFATAQCTIDNGSALDIRF